LQRNVPNKMTQYLVKSGVFKTGEARYCIRKVCSKSVKKREIFVKIYLIRHGRTKDNEEKRFVGWQDTDLSEEGCLQAEKLALRFQDKKIGALYSSDLLRAIKTAEILGKKQGIKPRKSNMLREINFGEWEGLTYEEIMHSYKKEAQKWLKNPLLYSPPGGESLLQVYARMEKFLNSLSPPENNDEAIVLVSHGGAILSVLHKYLGLRKEDIWKIKIKNTAISLLQKKGALFEVVFFNDVRHIENEMENDKMPELL